MHPEPQVTDVTADTSDTEAPPSTPPLSSSFLARAVAANDVAGDATVALVSTITHIDGATITTSDGAY